MLGRKRWIVSLVLGLVLTLGLAACGTDEPTPTEEPEPTSAPGQTPTAEPEMSAFDELVERARADAEENNVLRLPLGFFSPEQVVGFEDLFEERFGFRVELELEPGHPQIEVPTKVIEAGSQEQGVIDSMHYGTTVVIYPVADRGLLEMPRWDIWMEEWPEIELLRDGVPDWEVPGGRLNDFCTLNFHALWVWNYNTNNVDPSEVADFQLDDLLTEQWRGRVLVPDIMLAFYHFPLFPGWSEERLRAYTHNLAVNDARMVSGGSVGLHQALLQGEGDIAQANAAWTQIQDGAPLNFTTAEYTTGANPNISCIPKYRVNPSLDLAELFWAWDVVEGRIQLGNPPHDFGSAGYLFPEFKDDVPLMKYAYDELGLRIDQLHHPESLEENQLSTEWRAVAQEGFQQGLDSGEPVDYPWAD